MPLGHYIDDEYRYILFRQHRFLPLDDHVTMRRFQWQRFGRVLRISWPVVRQYLLVLIHKGRKITIPRFP